MYTSRRQLGVWRHSAISAFAFSRRISFRSSGDPSPCDFVMNTNDARRRCFADSRSNPRGSTYPLSHGLFRSTSTMSTRCCSFRYWNPSSRISVSHPSFEIA